MYRQAGYSTFLPFWPESVKLLYYIFLPYFLHSFIHVYFCSKAVPNVMCSLLFGERYEYSDLEFTEMRHLIAEEFLLMDKTFLLNYVPEMRFIPSMREQYSMDII